VPNHEWGGEGSLGCDVGYGYLHRIPKRKVTINNESDPVDDALLEEPSQIPLPPSPILTPEQK
jgi:hypothetical protein